MKKTSDKYYSSSSSASSYYGYMVGSGGSEQWLFEAKDIGTTIIKLEYMRPWESDALEDTFEIEVIVCDYKSG